MRKLGSEIKGVLYECLAVSIWMILLLLFTIILFEVCL